jgi:four helix bundle protein
MDNSERRFRLGDMEAYRISFALSNRVWEVVLQWDYLAKNTVGTQLIRAVDSISANLAEGFGRYGKKDKIKFYRIARGSLMEALDWNEKAKVRQLLAAEQYAYIFSQLQLLPKSINVLIKYANSSLQE